MAEAVTYADLRFVKAPLKKSLSCGLGPEAEAYEDGDAYGELTYENVQVPSAPGGASGAPSGVGDQAGVHSEPTAASWSPVTSPGVPWTLPCPATCLQYVLLGLLLTCLLLAVATICLGVRYLQASQQLQHTKRVLEATNSSQWQQLRQKLTQLGQKEGDLQESRKALAQSQEELQEERRLHLAAQEQLRTCQVDGEKTKETLRGEEKQREALERRLSTTKDALRRFFTCPSEDTCCPMGWTLHERRCFYFSATKKTWEESKNHCTSLSSTLATFGLTYYYRLPSSYSKLLSGSVSESYWIGLHSQKARQSWSEDLKSRYYYQSSDCVILQKEWLRLWQSDKCATHLPWICELAAFRFPDGYSLH
ncbi:B-cell differentiation antigen CD72 isoform X2 [Cavia porcellus]|uniref:CD72 molecule n=1 Tax=Cavia porcellus TaxID=10141 RepID=A0A286X7J6_CAVPO|nr:B-cell differentiation antigen CD72 isoform X2 [Cavia porcellus]